MAAQVARAYVAALRQRGMETAKANIDERSAVEAGGESKAAGTGTGIEIRARGCNWQTIGSDCW